MANFPIAALFVLAWAGIPLWMVLRRPDRRPDFSEARAYYRAKAELNRAVARTTGRPVPVEPVRAGLQRQIGVLSAWLAARRAGASRQAPRRPDRGHAPRTRQRTTRQRHPQPGMH